MASDGRVVIDVILEDGQVAKGVANLKGQLGSLDKDGGGKLSGISNGIKGIVSVAAIGATAVAGIGIAIGGLAAPLVKAAANAQAMNAQFEQVFGDLQSNAQKSVDELGNAFGMLPERIKPMFSKTSSQFKGLGLDVEEAMKKAEQATSISANAASFFDVSMESAGDSLNSFIKGNYEGGEAIGVFANETQMANYAIQQGLVGSADKWSKLDEATKQATRLDYAENMLVSAGAIDEFGQKTGQASRESGALENVLGNLKQAWTNLMAVVGEPILAAVIPIIQGLTTVLQDVTTKVQELFSAFEGGNLGEMLMSAFSADGLSGVFTTLMTMLPQLMQMGSQMVQNLVQGITSNLPQLISTAITMVDTWFTNLSTMYPMLLEAGVKILTSLIGGISSNLPSLINAALNIVTSIVSTIIGLLPELLKSGIEILKSLIGGIVDSIPTLIDTISDVISTLLDTILGMLPDIILMGVELLLSLIQGILDTLPKIIAAILNVVDKLIETILANLPKFITAAIEIILALIDGIVQALPKIITAILTLVTKLVEVIIGNIPLFISAAIQIILALIVGVVQATPKIIAAIFGLIGNLAKAFTEFDWKSIGKDIIQGLINGIDSMASAVWSKVKAIADGIKNTIQSALDIHSPSRWMRDFVAGNMAKGFSVGVDKNEGLVTSAASRLGEMVKPDVVNKLRGVRADFGTLTKGSSITTQNNSNSNSYDQSKKMYNQITIQESTDTAKSVEKALRRLQFQL